MNHKSIRENSAGVVGWLVALIIIIIILAAAGAGWYFWGRNTSTTPSTPITVQPTAKQDITSNWEKFFNGKTSASTKIGLLEDGDQFAQVIQAQSKSATAQATTAKVTDVNVTGNTATVTYTIYENGKSALANQTGQAIKQDGLWKVSDTAFCNLLQLSGNVPANCPAGTNTGNNTTNGGASTNSGSTNTQSGTDQTDTQQQTQTQGTTTQ